MRWRLARWTVVVIVMALIGAGLAIALHRTSDTADRLIASQSDRDALAKKLDTQKQATNALAEQVKGLGGTPVVEPSKTTPTTVSKADVAAAVVAYCSAERCRGPKGVALSPTRSQVAQAVAAYCADGKCKGASGSNGTNGSNGKDVTAAQVADAVSDYCSTRDQCRGENGTDGNDGENGTDGINGKDGRGITSVTCTDLPTMTLDITYSDGSTETVTCGRR